MNTGLSATDRIADSYFNVGTAGAVVAVPFATVSHIESAANYVRLFTDQDVITLRVTMALLERMLAPDLFVRIHRRHFVNQSHIKTVMPAALAVTVVMRCGVRLAVGRKYQEGLSI